VLAKKKTSVSINDGLLEWIHTKLEKRVSSASVSHALSMLLRS
jgi:hypothetical protein